jgi:hypothetical protein
VSQTARPIIPLPNRMATQIPPSLRQLTARTTARAADLADFRDVLLSAIVARRTNGAARCGKRPPRVERRLHRDQHRRIRSADGRSGAESALRGVASGKIEVCAKAAIPLRARTRLHRPNKTFTRLTRNAGPGPPVLLLREQGDLAALPRGSAKRRHLTHLHFGQPKQALVPALRPGDRRCRRIGRL